MDEPWKNYTKWRKSETENKEYLLNNSIIWIGISKSKETDLGGKGLGDGTNWE